MWELDSEEGWALKNWCFWTVVLKKALESPLDSKEIKSVNPIWNQSKYSLGELMLNLKLQYFGHLMQRANSLEKTLMLEKTEGRRRGQRGWDGWMSLPNQCTWVLASSGRWWRTGKPGMLQSIGTQRIEHDWVTEKQQQHPIFFIHCSINGRLSFFHVLAIVKRALMNIGVHMCFWTRFLVFFLFVCLFFNICTGVRLQGHVLGLFLAFYRTSTLFSIVSVPIYIPSFQSQRKAMPKNVQTIAQLDSPHTLAK